MTKKQSEDVMERHGASRNITSIHLRVHLEEAELALLLPGQGGRPGKRIGKGTLVPSSNVRHIHSSTD